MNVSLLKKGGKALGPLLLCLLMSVGMQGLAFAQGSPKVTVNPNQITETNDGSFGITAIASHLTPLLGYTFNNSVVNTGCIDALGGVLFTSDLAGRIILADNAGPLVNGGPACPAGKYTVSFDNASGSFSVQYTVEAPD